MQILRANPAAGVLLEEIDAELAQVMFLNAAVMANKLPYSMLCQLGLGLRCTGRLSSMGLSDENT